MKLILRITVAWWLRPYLHALSFFCDVTGREPDWDKLGRVMQRAVKVRT